MGLDPLILPPSDRPLNQFASTVASLATEPSVVFGLVYQVGQQECSRRTTLCGLVTPVGRRDTSRPYAPEGTQVRTMRDHTRKKEDTNIVNGKVGFQEVPFVLDTGTLISVVPEEFVGEEQMLSESVLLVDANGGEVRRPLAEVWLHVGDYPPNRRLRWPQERPLRARLY